MYLESKKTIYRVQNAQASKACTKGLRNHNFVQWRAADMSKVSLWHIISFFFYPYRKIETLINRLNLRLSQKSWSFGYILKKLFCSNSSDFTSCSNATKNHLAIVFYECKSEKSRLRWKWACGDFHKQIEIDQKVVCFSLASMMKSIRGNIRTTFFNHNFSGHRNFETL